MSQAEPRDVLLPCTDARSFPPSRSDMLHAEDLLTAEEQELRMRVRRVMVRGRGTGCIAGLGAWVARTGVHGGTAQAPESCVRNLHWTLTLAGHHTWHLPLARHCVVVPPGLKPWRLHTTHLAPAVVCINHPLSLQASPTVLNLPRAQRVCLLPAAGPTASHH